MGKKRVRNDNQEVIIFDNLEYFGDMDTLRLESSYSHERAKAAAKRRDQRMGTTPRLSEFRSKTKGLFVPQSKGEQTAIVDDPVSKAVKEANRAKFNSTEKNRSIGLSPRVVRSRAARQYRKSFNEQIGKYTRYQSDALSNVAILGVVISENDGIIDRDLFEFNPDYKPDPDGHNTRSDILAYNSLLEYLIFLRVSFGQDQAILNDKGDPKWPQKRHTKKYPEHMQREHDELVKLPNYLYVERVDEAYWNHFCRSRYWNGIISGHEVSKRQKRQEETVRLGNQPPDEDYLASLTQLDPPEL